MKVPAFLLCILLLFLCGCGSGNEQTSASATESVASSETSISNPSVSAPASMSVEQQKQLIMDHYEEWSYKEPWESPWFYTFTDLDHNGRLEVTAACLQGTGFYTYAHYREVNPDYTGLTECQILEEQEGSSYPDIIIDSASCYYDASAGIYYYIYEDMLRSGFSEYYLSINAISLHDGVISVMPLAARYETYDHGETPPVVTYYDGTGQEIDKQTYQSAEADFAIGKEKSTLSIEWIEVENPLP